MSDKEEELKKYYERMIEFLNNHWNELFLDCGIPKIHIPDPNFYNESGDMGEEGKLIKESLEEAKYRQSTNYPKIKGMK